MDSLDLSCSSLTNDEQQAPFCHAVPITPFSLREKVAEGRMRDSMRMKISVTFGSLTPTLSQGEREKYQATLRSIRNSKLSSARSHKLLTGHITDQDFADSDVAQSPFPITFFR